MSDVVVDCRSNCSNSIAAVIVIVTIVVINLVVPAVMVDALA